jgi:TolB-like protein/Tfp pilus assembly protein PilF
MATPPLAFGPFLLDPETGSLTRSGETVVMGQRPAALLAELARTPGRIRTKGDLLDAAWPGLAVEESNLSVQIAAIRKLLGPAASGGDWIETIPRVGYRLVGGPAVAEAAATGPVLPSLAVLPFSNLSDDPQQDYFADGVVEDVITALSRFRSFAVIARNSSFVYRGKVADIRAVAAELGVRYVVEGSVRRLGERLRIAAKLIDCGSATNLWAQAYDGRLDEVFDFQDRITANVAALVEPYIQTAEIERSRRERPGSVAAYDLYLQGLPRLYSETPEGNAEAYRLFAEAVALEPDNATYLAHAGWALGHRYTMGLPATVTSPTERRVALARRALDRAAGDARVMAIAATDLLHVARDYDVAMSAIDAAVDINPNDITVVLRAGIGYLHCGSVDDALAFFHRAIRLSRVDVQAHFSLTGIAHAEMIRGNEAEALSFATRSLAVNSSFAATYWMLISANARLGRMDEAGRYLAALRRLAPGVTVASIWGGQPQRDPLRLAAIFDGLRLAGLEEGAVDGGLPPPSLTSRQPHSASSS